MDEAKAGSAPAYLRIAADLRAQITSGALAPDAQLPTEHELAGRWGVARQTARNGLTVLVSEGLVVSRRPRGHFVRRPEPYLDYRLQEQACGATQTTEPALDVVDRRGEAVLVVEAAGIVAERLQLAQGALVVVRRSVHRIAGRPVRISDIHYPFDLVKDTPIMSPDDGPADVVDPDRILADLGYAQVRVADQLSVQMPTPEHLRWLDLASGEPVGVHGITGYTADDQAVRHTVNVLPGHLHRIVLERELHYQPSGSDAAASQADREGSSRSMQASGAKVWSCEVLET